MRADIERSRSCVKAGDGSDVVRPVSKPSIELSSVLLPFEACKGQGEQSSYIYTRAIIIQPSSCISSVPSSADDDVVDDERNIICSAIRFNLALLNQIRASRTIVSSSSPETNNALRMYEMCNDLLRNRAGTQTAAGPTTSRHANHANMLAIACLNNMSQLLNDLGQACESRQILCAVQRLLVGEEAFNRSLLFDESDLQGIMINALFLHLPTSAAGAA